MFTHLPPHDYRTMLTMLRPYIRADGKLFYSLFIDELTEGGHGLIDAWSRLLQANPESLELDADGRRRVEKFRELDPARPGLYAVYSEEYAS